MGESETNDFDAGRNAGGKGLPSVPTGSIARCAIAARERAYLGTARGGYIASVEKGEADSPRRDITLHYLVADLSKRIGDNAEASRWARLTMAHSQFSAAKAIAQATQTLRDELRALKVAD
ncbi:MAG: DUF2225 domain-containing protein [Chloroflexi bacterium]|nr:DUF2225 domain-containing protein [Chloroflexota bacterium]